MITLDNPMPGDVELIGSRIGRMDTDNFQDQSSLADGPTASEDNDEDEPVEADELDDEPTDEDGDPTGEHDHQQDDNYALGGHVTRSGSV